MENERRLILDTETTGLNFENDKIIEIGSGKVLTGLNRGMKIKQDFLNITTFNDIENFIKSHGENLWKKMFY